MMFTLSDSKKKYKFRGWLTNPHVCYNEKQRPTLPWASTCWYRCTANASPAWLEGGHCCLGGWTIGRVKYNPWMGTCRVRRAGAKELGVCQVWSRSHSSLTTSLCSAIFFCNNLFLLESMIWSISLNQELKHKCHPWIFYMGPYGFRILIELMGKYACFII